LVKDGASAIRSLGTSVDTTTKALNPSTTLGDIEYRSSTANTNTRLGIGSTGQILTVAGGVPSWAAPAAGGGLTLISETVASGLSSLSFTSLGSYKQLKLMYFGVRASDGTSVFSLRFNNNSGAVYPTSGIQVKNTSVESYAAAPTSIKGDVAGAAIYSFGDGAAATGQTSTDVMGVITIDNYTSSTKYKMVHTSVNYYANGVGQYHAMNINSFFNDTTAITSLDIVRLAGSGTFSNSANTTIRLYGVS
jgi:hypothetical protein